MLKLGFNEERIILFGQSKNTDFEQIKVQFFKWLSIITKTKLFLEEKYREKADNEELDGESEGDIKIKEHIIQELKYRNSKIIKDAKNKALKDGNGRIKCECCEFDFVKTYGNHGIGFIECHHKIHLSQGQRITRIKDLALVCSNCHRMLHRKKVDLNYFNVSELKKIIDNF